MCFFIILTFMSELFSHYPQILYFVLTNVVTTKVITVLLAYLRKQLHARACQQLKLLCLTLATVTRLRNLYLGGLIELNRFVRNHSSGMRSGWIVTALGMVSWLTACGGLKPNINTAYARLKETKILMSVIELLTPFFSFDFIYSFSA